VNHVRRRAGRGPAACAAVAAAAVVLAGCTGGGDEPDLSAAPGGGTPACTALVGRVPGTVLDRSRSTPQAAGVAVWGDPPIVLRCGVDAPAGPTSNPCVTVDGVDWLLENPDTTDEPASFLSYGRTPAIRVTVPGARQDAAGALVDLAPAVTPLPAAKRCE
jgi:hypothetical protein